MAVQLSKQSSLLLGLCAVLLVSQISTVLAQKAQQHATQESALFGAQHNPSPVASRPQSGDGCPKPYTRQAIEDIRTKKARPYLFGGSRTPCDSCHEGQVAEFCQFLRPPNDQWKVRDPALDLIHPKHTCDKERQEQIVEWALRMDLHGMLQFTPCDLWPLVKQRSLWIVGDSEVRHLLLPHRQATLE